MKKIPCIKYNEKDFDYIERNLISFGYKEKSLYRESWGVTPYIVINYCDELGYYSNVGYEDSLNYNRELIDNIEEFLERAAELKGFTYKKNDIVEINGVEIKPGMVIVTNSNERWIVFPKQKELAVVRYGKDIWESLSNFIIDHSKEIETIYDLTGTNFLTGGIVLWEKPKEVVITMDEIAKKFGYPVEVIKIKK